MKIFLILLFSIVLQNEVLGQLYFKTEYPVVWQRATDYTLAVAESMPADKYDFKPKDENMSFHGQMVHLIQNLAFLSKQVTGSQPDFFEGKNPDVLTKDQITTVLKSSLQFVSNLIQSTNEKALRDRISFAGEKLTKENVFYLMRDHMTHHRAQAILYLRMNGLEPPTYRGW